MREGRASHGGEQSVTRAIARWPGGTGSGQWWAMTIEGGRMKTARQGQERAAEVREGEERRARGRETTFIERSSQSEEASVKPVAYASQISSFNAYRLRVTTLGTVSWKT